MTDMEQVVKDLAVCAAIKQIVDDRIKALKTSAAEMRRGTVYAYAGDDELGYISVPKPSVKSPVIVDEDRAVAWAVETFGESAMTVRLSDTGKRDVIEAFKKGAEVPGVVQPESTPPSPRFKPAENIVELVRGMAERGELDASLVPMVEASR